MISKNIKDAIDRYVKHGIPTGSFTEAVLSNDLKGALGQADETSMANLFDIVSYCYNEIPLQCWGSPEKVKDWIERIRKQKEKEKDAS